MADEILDRFEVLGSEVKRYAHISGGDTNLALAIAKLRKGGDIATELSVIEQLRTLGYLQSKIARELNMSRADVSRRLSIIDNLISPLKERVVDAELRISTAWELSKLSPEVQEEYAEKDNITLAEVQERRRIETIGKLNLGDIKIPEQKAPKSFKLKQNKILTPLVCDKCKNHLPLFIVQMIDSPLEGQYCKECLQREDIPE